MAGNITDEEKNSIDTLADIASDMAKSSQNDEMVFERPQLMGQITKKIKADGSQAEIKAKKLMDSMYKQYAKSGVIDKNQDLKRKSQVYSANLTTVIKQISIAEELVNTMIASLEIDPNPKIFDSVSNSQKTIIELVKLEQQLIADAEIKMRDMAGDIPDAVEEDKPDMALMSSSRQLLEVIKNVVKNNDPEEDEQDQDEEPENVPGSDGIEDVEEFKEPEV